MRHDFGLRFGEDVVPGALYWDDASLWYGVREPCQQSRPRRCDRGRFGRMQEENGDTRPGKGGVGSGAGKGGAGVLDCLGDGSLVTIG